MTEFIDRAFSSIVLVIPSRDAEAIAATNHLSLCEMVNPFGQFHSKFPVTLPPLPPPSGKDGGDGEREGARARGLYISARRPWLLLVCQLAASRRMDPVRHRLLLQAVKSLLARRLTQGPLHSSPFPHPTPPAPHIPIRSIPQSTSRSTRTRSACGSSTCAISFGGYKTAVALRIEFTEA